jgi:hypothetical protein
VKFTLARLLGLGLTRKMEMTLGEDSARAETGRMAALNSTVRARSMEIELRKKETGFINDPPQFLSTGNFLTLAAFPVVLKEQQQTVKKNPHCLPNSLSD